MFHFQSTRSFGALLHPLGPVLFQWVTQLPEQQKKQLSDRAVGALCRSLNSQACLLTHSRALLRGHDGGKAPSPVEGEAARGTEKKQVSSRGRIEGRAVAEGVSGATTYHGAETRIVTVAGLSCPCGGTHVRSTRELEGVRVTKVKAKKSTLRVSYTLVSPQ